MISHVMCRRVHTLRREREREKVEVDTKEQRLGLSVAHSVLLSLRARPIVLTYLIEASCRQSALNGGTRSPIPSNYPEFLRVEVTRRAK